MNESVEVTAVMGETVNRTNGEVARTIDSQQIKDLAFNGRNYLELASLIPGAVATDYDPLALATSLSVTGQSINGSRGNTNNLTVDGASNLDSGSNGSQINNVSLSFIEQVKIQTSNFSSELGRNSGAAINVVTRSGTNRFQGTARYDFRDEKFDEPNFFAARDANGNKTKPELEFRNFEGALGGPVLRNKLFFFGGQQYRVINRFTNPSRQTMPTRAELAGDFAFRLRGADNIVGTADDGVLRDPATGLQFPGNVIPSSRITTDGRAIANTYGKMIDLAARVHEHADREQRDLPAIQPLRAAPGHHPHRLAGHREPARPRTVSARRVRSARSVRRVLGRAAADRADQPVSPRHELSGRPYLGGPLEPGQRGSHQRRMERPADQSRGRHLAAGDVWLPVSGALRGGLHRRRHPQRHRHRLPQPGRAVVRAALADDRHHVPGHADLHAGRHSIRTGVAISRNRKDQNGRAAYLGAAGFSVAGNPNSTSNALADALLGNFRTYNEASADPVGFFRFTAYQAFASDTWRLRPNLSLELGVRYEYVQPTYAQGNNLVNFDPSLYDPAQAVTVLPNGLLVANSGNRFNGLITAGDGVPEDQQGRVELLTGGDYSRIPNGAPRGLYDAQHLLMPRASFAYSLNEATVIRGGGGVFYDKPEGNLVFSQLNIPPILDNVTYENFNIAAPSGGAAGAIGALGDINAIDPNLKLARQINFSIGVQRELGQGYFVEAAYVGNRGDFLLRQPDINRASFDALRANAALPAAQRVSTNFLRPYRGYSAIRMRLSDAESDYDSLQLYATKRRGAITFTTSYTLSKVITDASGNGDNDTAEAAGDRSYTRGPATFDRRHAFVGTFTYRVPFLLDRGDLLEAIGGGWQVSGKVRLQSGQYYTATGNSSIGGRRANYTGAEIRIDDRNELRWFNTDAFTVPDEGARGTATVGQILGPSFYQWDLSFRKNFRFGGRYQATPIFDVFNLFNRLNLGAPNTNVSDGGYGTINTAQPVATVPARGEVRVLIPTFCPDMAVQTQMKDAAPEQRGVPAIETVVQDARYAIRTLLRAPGFTAAVLLTLALGTGANTAIFSVVNTVLLRPLPYPEADRLVQLVRRHPSGVGTGQTGVRYLFFRDHMRIGPIAAWRNPTGINLVNGDNAEFIRAMPVSKEFFDVYGVRPAIGGSFTADHDRVGGPLAAVISDGLWRRQFGGNPAVVGSSILLGERPHVVVGVMPASFVAIPPADLYVPLRPSTTGPGGGFNYGVTARVPAGATLEQVNAQAAATWEAMGREFPKVLRPNELPSGFEPLQATSASSVRPALLAILGAVGLLLVIACANSANLLLARASARGREIAVRAALGASRGRIIRQLLTESVVLSIAGAALGIALAYWAMPLLLSLTPPQFRAYQQVHLDSTVLLVTLSIAVGTGLLFGLAPAIAVSRPDLVEAFKDDGTRSVGSARSAWLRQSLVAGEVALCMLLLVGAALLVQTFVRMRAVDPGFDPAHVVTARMSLQGERYATQEAYTRFFEEGLERLRRIPGVRAAAVVNGVPIERGLNLNIDILDIRDGQRQAAVRGHQHRLALRQLRLLLDDGHSNCRRAWLRGGR